MYKLFFATERENSSLFEKKEKSKKSTHWQHIFELREWAGLYQAEEVDYVIFKCSTAADHTAGNIK